MIHSPSYIYDKISTYDECAGVFRGGSVRTGEGHLGGLLLYLFWAINLWYSIWESSCSSSCLVRSASWWFPAANRNVHVQLTQHRDDRQIICHAFCGRFSCTLATPRLKRRLGFLVAQHDKLPRLCYTNVTQTMGGFHRCQSRNVYVGKGLLIYNV